MSFEDGIYHVDSDRGELELRTFPADDATGPDWIPLLCFHQKNGVSAPRLIHSDEQDPDILKWEGFSAIRSDLSVAWEALPTFKDLPQGIVHSDFLYHNVIRTPDGTPALIDWDGAGIGSAVQDIGYFFKSYAVSPGKEGLRAEFAEAFLSGYTGVRQLTRREWEAIPDAMIYGSIFTVLWYVRVYERAWFRTRLILDHRHAIADRLAEIRESL